MKPRTFAALSAAAFLSALCLLAGCIFAAHRLWGTDRRPGVTDQCNAIIGRQEKADYISGGNCAHTGFVIGGSKAGALRAEVLNSFAGGDYYNFYVSSGNFRDFDLYAGYILKECTDAESIILHLSSHEAEKFMRIPYIPVQMQSNPLSRLHSLGQFVREKYLGLQTFNLLRSRRRADTGVIGISCATGERDAADDAFVYSSYEADPQKFCRDVLCYWTDWDSALKSLFRLTKEPPLPACEKNIRALRRIKSECGQNGVKLTVVIGPTFIAECHRYASGRYVQYVKDIVSVLGSVWNFSGINDVNMNPHNFYNGGHCWLFVGDKMIEAMFAGEPNVSDMDAFGILLTPENVNAFIARQKEKWQELKLEYECTGTIALQTKQDASYLGPAE